MRNTVSREKAAPAAVPGLDLAVRKPSVQDIPALLRLINANASQGIMLPRTEFEISENLRDFTVCSSGDAVAGCGALHLYTPAVGEIRSLAVAPEWQRYGIGRKLMEALENEAHSFGLQAVFAFTYVPVFFRKLGFQEVDRGALPLKAWKDCLRCPKFQCCDEIAVIKGLVADWPGVASPPIGGERPSTDAAASVPLPRAAERPFR